MAKAFLVEPGDVEQRLHKSYHAHHKTWLSGKGQWPLNIPLGIPTEQQALDNLHDVQQWQQQWLQWQGEGEINWVERRWPKVGSQKLPERILIHSPSQVARWIGKEKIWHHVEKRYSNFVARWPSLAGVLAKYFGALAEYDDDDINRLVAVLDWLEQHPRSNLYIRQLPIEGIHSKWMLSRRSMITELLNTIRGSETPVEFYPLTGIRRESALVRFRVLDDKLRSILGGLGDITATIEDINNLQLPVTRLYIVENLQTGLAFNDIPGALVFMRLGYAVDLYGHIQWLKHVPIVYWGDIDTHGFAILNRLRNYFPDVRSILMDEATFLANKSYWSEEEKPVVDADLDLLTTEERELYRDLCGNRWGIRLRLEQERILWDYAWTRILSATK
ncbi:MAG: DUF2220 family protein [Gammaproteobacteria bacterium]|jgi:hypothetical protein